MSIDEQEIQFKKRARRRLVGAIALVLLMVTILPMVLDDRSVNLPQQEIEITIPGRDDDDFTSTVTPYEPEAGVSVPQDMSSAPRSSDSEEQGEALVAADKPASVAASAPVDATNNQPAVKPKPSPVAVSPTYSVQVGVFSDAANVRQLEGRLKALGLPPGTESLQTAQGEKFRLRVGPFSSREQAETVAGKIKAAGLSGMIITNK